MPDQPLFEQLDQAIETLLAGGIPPEEAPELAEIARRLRYLPDENFKTRLKTELQRRISMTASATVTLREGFRTVTPYISVADGDKLIEFVKEAFGAEELSRHMAGSGHFHAEVRIGDSMLMIGYGERFRGHETPTALHVYVEDCDAAYARAIAAGATPLGSMAEPADRPYGERSGFVQDVFGNYWYIATRLAANPDAEKFGAILPYLHPQKARPYIEFLKNAFGAEQMAVYEHEGRVMHAAVRIGDSVLEMGEAGEEYRPMQSGFFMYVNDVDAVYERAVAAGATSLRPPTDEAAGHRGAALKDPFGFGWYVATPL
jgi:PhnB protein